MIEHRLIERAIELMKHEKKRLKSGGELDPVTIDTLVDFIKTCADRCHHGKEEDILFEDLKGRSLPDDAQRLMDELIEEHKLGRRLTNSLVEAKDAVVAGQAERLPDVMARMQELIDFYPQHIEKEDKHFFPDTEQHYSKEELEQMIKSFYNFDMQMVHEKYQNAVGSLEHSG